MAGVGYAKCRTLLTAASAALVAAVMAGSAVAEDKPQPPSGGSPGASTGVGDTPIVGGGSNGNGGVLQGKPGNGQIKDQKGTETDLKAQQPQLSK